MTGWNNATDPKTVKLQNCWNASNSRKEFFQKAERAGISHADAANFENEIHSYIASNEGDIPIHRGDGLIWGCLTVVAIISFVLILGAAVWYLIVPKIAGLL